MKVNHLMHYLVSLVSLVSLIDLLDKGKTIAKKITDSWQKKLSYFYQEAVLMMPRVELKNLFSLEVVRVGLLVAILMTIPETCSAQQPNVFAGLALGVSMWAGVYSLIGLFYALSIQLVMLLWKTFALILYLFAPICVCFGVIPGFGTRIVANWYGAVVQLSAWQIWIALCSRFINNTSDIIKQQ